MGVLVSKDEIRCRVSKIVSKRSAFVWRDGITVTVVHVVFRLLLYTGIICCLETMRWDVLFWKVLLRGGALVWRDGIIYPSFKISSTVPASSGSSFTIATFWTPNFKQFVPKRRWKSVLLTPKMEKEIGHKKPYPHQQRIAHVYRAQYPLSRHALKFCLTRPSPGLYCLESISVAPPP